MNVVRVTNPEAFKREEVRELARAALLPSQSQNIDSVIDEVAGMCHLDHCVVLAGIEDGHVKGFIVAFLPQTVLYKSVQILAVCNKGSPKLLRDMLDFGMALIRGKGYTKVLTVNATGKEQRVYDRLFRRYGAGKVLGVMMEYSLT